MGAHRQRPLRESTSAVLSISGQGFLVHRLRELRSDARTSADPRADDRPSFPADGFSGCAERNARALQLGVALAGEGALAEQLEVEQVLGTAACTLVGLKFARSTREHHRDRA